MDKRQIFGHRRRREIFDTDIIALHKTHKTGYADIVVTPSIGSRQRQTLFRKGCFAIFKLDRYQDTFEPLSDWGRPDGLAAAPY